MTHLMAALIVVFSVQATQAAQATRRSGKPFSTSGGRTTIAAPVVTATPVPAQASAMTPTTIAGSPVSGGRSFIGAGRQAVSHGPVSRSVRRSGKPFGATGRAAIGSSAAAEEEAPPNFTKPGALIRTTGQQPKYETADVRAHTIDAGEIVLNSRKAIHVRRSPGLQDGPPDKLPPTNPGTGRSGTAAVANSPAGGGGDNNGSGNNSRNSDTYDEKGREKHQTDPTGFDDAF